MHCPLSPDTILSMLGARLIHRIHSHRHLQWSRQLEIIAGAPTLLLGTPGETLSSCQGICLKYEDTKAPSSPISPALSHLFCPFSHILTYIAYPETEQDVHALVQTELGPRE